MTMDSKTCLACKGLNPANANFCMQCGVKFPQHTKPKKEHMCHIDSFTARKKNNVLLLEWVVVNADKIVLNGTDVTGKTSCEVSVKGAQHYILRADNDVSFDVESLHLYCDTVTEYRERTIVKRVNNKGWIVTLLIVLILLLATGIYWYLYSNWYF